MSVPSVVSRPSTFPAALPVQAQAQVLMADDWTTKLDTPRLFHDIPSARESAETLQICRWLAHIGGSVSRWIGIGGLGLGRAWSKIPGGTAKVIIS
jgi:hypothetical protein